MRFPSLFYVIFDSVVLPFEQSLCCVPGHASHMEDDEDGVQKFLLVLIIFFAVL